MKLIRPMSNISTPTYEVKKTGSRASLLGRIRRLFASVFGTTARKCSVSLVDQIVVSGTNFITTLMVGRSGGSGELANYALGFTLVILTIVVLEALIILPYTIFANRLEGAARAEYRGTVLLQCGLLATLAALVLAGWSMVSSIGFNPQGLTPVLYVLSLVIPFYILKEFARQLSLAQLNSKTALQIDLCAGTLQLICVAILAAGRSLSAVTVYATIGAVNAVVALVWLILSRNDFVVQRTQFFPIIRQNLAFGRWILAGQIISQLNSGTFVLWLIAFVLGNNATGIFAACITIAQLSNPFVLSMGTVLTPRIAQVFSDSNIEEVQRVVRKATVIIALVLSAFCIGVFLFGDKLSRVFYGNQFDGNTHIITVLSLSILALALSMPASSSLLTLGRPDVNFKASVVGLLLTVTVASVLVFPLKMLGVALGVLSGQIGVCAVLWIVFSRISIESAPPRHRSISITGDSP